MMDPYPTRCPTCQRPFRLLKSATQQHLTVKALASAMKHAKCDPAEQRTYHIHQAPENAIEEREPMAPTTTPPSKADIKELGRIAFQTATQYVLQHVIAIDGYRMAAAIRAIITSLRYSRYDNAQQVRLAIQDATSNVLGDHAKEWKSWMINIENDMQQRGVRDEITSFVPLTAAWTEIAYALENATAIATDKITKRNIQNKARNDRPWPEPTDEQLRES